jgi:flagellar basal-body rod protein FlgC
MSLFNSLRVSASGMTAQRLRMDVIADNVANADSTGGPLQGPYKRKLVVFSEALDRAQAGRVATRSRSSRSMVGAGRTQGTESLAGVKVVGIVEDSRQGPLVYDPGHPHADENGYVEMPNVDIVREMVDMISASRAYESNIAVFEATKAMFLKALDIGR